MREENPNWFAKREDELPSPDELMPLSQTLITPHLALAFDIQSLNHHGIKKTTTISHQQQRSTPPPPPTSMPMEFGADSAELGSGAVGGGEEPARTLKRPRLVWTPQLHKRFVDAVAHLGIKNAVPKTIMQLMSVDGLTRENVASHLQKYRLYLKRMQGFPGGNGGGNGGGGSGGHVSDPATDHLFASSPVPAHFLSPGLPGSDHFMTSFVPVATKQQMAAAAVAHHNLQPLQYHHRQVGKFDGQLQSGQLEHSFLARRVQQPIHRMGTALNNTVPSYVEDLESGNGDGGRKVLTLFPTGDD